MVKRLLPLLVVAYLAPHPGEAAVGLSPAEAASLVQQAMVRAGISDAAPVPPSRALPPCDGTVAVAPHQGGWATVSLSCDAPVWTRALRSRSAPTGALARSPSRPEQATVTVLGLVRSLGKGATIGPDDIGPVKVSEASPDQTYTDPADLVGRSLKQALGSGKPVLARHLQPSYLVTAESQVLILSTVGGISVASHGRAEGDAALGDVVSVTNLSSGRTLQARVTGKDIVSVTLKPTNSLP